MKATDEVIRALLIEDNQGDARLLRELLKEMKGLQIVLEHQISLHAGIQALAQNAYDVLLLDLSLPDSMGFDTFVKVYSQNPEIPIIILTGLRDEEMAVKSVRTGAQDYLVKGQIDSVHLSRSISYAIERAALLKTIQHELTERKANEKILRRLNRSLRLLSECNQIVVRAPYEEVLFNKICQAIKEFGEYHCAWISLVDRKTNTQVNVKAVAGVDKEYFINTDTAEWLALKEGSLLWDAMKSGNIVVCDNIQNDVHCASLRKVARELGCGSCIVLPLAIENQILGFIQICSQEISKPDNEELRLLDELREDVAYAIKALRMQREIIMVSKFPLENPYPVLRLDSEGLILFANEASQAILKKWNCSINTYAPKDWCGIITEVLTNKKTKTIEIEILESVISLAIVPIADAGYVNLYGRDITEAKRAEVKLLKSEAQLSNAMKIASLGHWELDIASSMFTFSDNLFEIFHTNAQKMGGYQMSIADYAKRFVHPEDAAMVSEETHKAMESNDPNFNRYVEHRILYADGGIGHIAVRFFIVKDLHGKTIRTYGVNQDITERKQAEEQLRMLSARNEAILGSVPDIIMEVNVNREYTWANRAGIEFFGEDVIGKEASYYFEGEQKTYNIVQPLFNGNEGNIYVESWQRRKDGKKRLLGWWCRVLKDKSGKVTGTLSTARDLTEQKLIDDLLRESEDKYRSIYEKSKIAILLTVPDGTIISANTYACQLFGRSEEDICRIGRNGLIDMNDSRLQVLLDERERKGSAIGELTFIRSDGSRFEGEISSAMFFDKDGRQKTSIIIQDLTERKRAEIKIRSALEEKEVLLREVHHRVKNNLQAMISLVSMRSKNVKDIETQEILKGLELQARTMSLVYEQLYQSEDLSRVQMAFYIEKLVLNVVESFGFDRRIERKIEVEKISLDVAHAMPCGLIINELVTNSMKYAFPPQFEGTQRITVKMYIEENACVLSVADSGVGLPIKFDIEKTKSNGLRLVKLWATHQLGGTLNIHTGKGSRFDIRFNIQQDKK